MKKETWKKLVRKTKNKGTYHMLRFSINDYLERFGCKGLDTVQAFIKTYSSLTVERWYLDYYEDNKK